MHQFLLEHCHLYAQSSYCLRICQFPLLSVSACGSYILVNQTVFKLHGKSLAPIFLYLCSVSFLNLEVTVWKYLVVAMQKQILRKLQTSSKENIIEGSRRRNTTNVWCILTLPRFEMKFLSATEMHAYKF